jgi:hypothetical protein
MSNFRKIFTFNYGSHSIVVLLANRNPRHFLRGQNSGNSVTKVESKRRKQFATKGLLRHLAEPDP